MLSPRAMAGQPRRCGAVGRSNTARNHSAVTGWKSASASISDSVVDLVRFAIFLLIEDIPARMTRLLVTLMRCKY